MPDYNTNQKMDGSGQHGYACRRITRGKSAGKFTIEYGLAERDGPACRSHIVRGTVEEAEARQFCEESLIAFPEPPAPRPGPYTPTGMLSRLVVGQWFLPYVGASGVRRPTYVCQQLHKRGILEQRWLHGVTPTSEQIADFSWDVKDFHEYRLTVEGVLRLNSFEVCYGTRTGWAQAAEDGQHFYCNGMRLCGSDGGPSGHAFHPTPPAQAQACPTCHQLLIFE